MTNQEDIIYGTDHNKKVDEAREKKTKKRWLIILLIINIFVMLIAAIIIGGAIFFGSILSSLSNIGDNLLDGEIGGVDEGYYYEDENGIITVFPEDSKEGGYVITPKEDGSVEVEQITEEEYFGGEVEFFKDDMLDFEIGNQYEDGFYYEDENGVITVFPENPEEGGYAITPNPDGSATVQPITEQEFFN